MFQVDLCLLANLNHGFKQIPTQLSAIYTLKTRTVGDKNQPMTEAPHHGLSS